MIKNLIDKKNEHKHFGLKNMSQKSLQYGYSNYGTRLTGKKEYFNIEDEQTNEDCIGQDKIEISRRSFVRGGFLIISLHS